MSTPTDRRTIREKIAARVKASGMSPPEVRTQNHLGWAFINDTGEIVIYYLASRELFVLWNIIDGQERILSGEVTR